MYPLSLTIKGEGTVTEVLLSSKSSGDYPSGSFVRITAVPNEGWNVFRGWSGDVESENSVIDVQINGSKNITATFEESSIIINKTRTFIETSVSTDDVQRSFYNVSGVFPYTAGGDHYMFFPGTSIGSNNLTKEDIPSKPSQILKRINGKWEFFKTDYQAYFWGARNFKIKDNFVAIGDGNEIGPDGPNWNGGESTYRNWNGDLYFGEILEDGNINWTVVNDLQNRSYFHGTTLGDINGDGNLDVGGSPNPGTNNLKLFTQESNGSFNNVDNILELIDGQPFTLEFSDLDNDGLDEIITADYGGGDPSSDINLNNLRVYKYNSQLEKFQIDFQSNTPSAFYNVGMGATSIQTVDLDKDNIIDIIVAREDATYGNSFEIWKGLSNGSFQPHYSSPIWTQDEMQFREFRIFDVNNDGFYDIILRPFHYGNLYRIDPVWWSVDLSNGIMLNTLIQINNGDGTFNSYDGEDLKIESLNVDNVHPYMDNGVLHFLGTYPGGNPFNIDTYDIKVRVLQ
jgi:hypothetical protein